MAGSKIILGHKVRTSLKLMPVLMPKVLASLEQAITQVRPRALRMPTGLPCKAGLACCSTEAKKLFKST